MTTTDDHPILAKVRKLLALAEDPAATTHEAETYTAKAAQLIADYGIDQALLAAADPGCRPGGRPGPRPRRAVRRRQGRAALHGRHAPAVPRRRPDPPHGGGQGALDAPLRARLRPRARRAALHQPAAPERDRRWPAPRSRRTSTRRAFRRSWLAGLPDGDRPPARRRPRPGRRPRPRPGSRPRAAPPASCSPTGRRRWSRRCTPPTPGSRPPGRARCPAPASPTAGPPGSAPTSAGARSRGRRRPATCSGDGPSADCWVLLALAGLGEACGDSRLLGVEPDLGNGLLEPLAVRACGTSSSPRCP